MPELTLANISKLLTEDVIDEVFKSITNSDDNVKNVEVTRAAPAGEGLMGAVYRIKVTGDIHTASIIAKGFVQDRLLLKSLKAYVLCEREALFIKQILPALLDIQKTLGAKESFQNSIPRFYTCYSDGVNDYILMEDMCEKEFASISASPTKCELNSTLKVLAHLHSLSIALRVKKPCVFEKITSDLNEIYYNEDNREWYRTYYRGAIDIDRKVFSEFPNTFDLYKKKFEELVEQDMYGQLIELASTWGEHPVVNHGDAWCSNFLCSEERAIAIDFQSVRCASPATDLSYFITMCSNQCTNKEDFNKGVELYYNSLAYYLKDMGLDPNEVFSFDTLNEEIKKYGKFGILAALSSIPLMASERMDVLQSFEEKYSDRGTIPLEELWVLTPLTSKDHKMRLINAVRMAVDLGLI